MAHIHEPETKEREESKQRNQQRGNPITQDKKRPEMMKLETKTAT